MRACTHTWHVNQGVVQYCTTPWCKWAAGSDTAPYLGARLRKILGIILAANEWSITSTSKSEHNRPCMKLGIRAAWVYAVLLGPFLFCTRFVESKDNDVARRLMVYAQIKPYSSAKTMQYMYAHVDRTYDMYRLQPQFYRVSRSRRSIHQSCKGAVGDTSTQRSIIPDKPKCSCETCKAGRRVGAVHLAC